MIPDPFLYRLLGSAAGIFGLICTLYSWHLAVFRIPTWKTVLTDFDTAGSPVTQFAFQFAWLPMCLSLLMVVAGAASALKARRSLLVVTVVLTLLTISSLLLADHAIDHSFWQLTKSLSKT